MQKTQIIEYLAQKNELSINKTSQVLNSLLDFIIEKVNNSEEVMLT
jgi:nucleoid DNA-binding protein